MAATTPTTQSYRNLRFGVVSNGEGNYPYIYLDTQKLLTVGIGALLYNAGSLQTVATTAILANVADPQLAKNIFAAIDAAKGSRAELEKVFVLEKIGGREALVRFKNGSAETDKSQWTDIRNFLPAAQATSALNQMADEVFEKRVNNLIDLAVGFNPNFAPTEVQRVALLSRVYNGLDTSARGSDGVTIPAKLASGNPLQIFEVFTWGRGGNKGEVANGHINRE